MQDLSATFPSLKATDDLSAPTARPEDESIRRIWQQPLGDVHVRLNNIVAPQGLKIRFDTNDADFVFELGSRWPISSDFTAMVYEADIIKLADALNALVRQYAIETGHTRLHVLLEARRGQFELPGWWSGSPIMFATYAFDTAFAEVGLFTNLDDAYGDMDLLTQPHRLLVAIGPATPDMLEVDEEGAWIDPDAERLRALKRWNQQMALQINMLMADIFGGGEEAMHSVVDALSKIRDLSKRLSDQILRLEKRAYRPDKKMKNDADGDLYNLPSASMRQPGRLNMDELETPGDVKESLADLRGALTQESQNKNIAPGMRLELQKGLRALNTLEASLGETPAVTPKAPRRKTSPRLKKMPAPAMTKIVRLTMDRRQQKAAFGTLNTSIKTLKRVRVTPRRVEPAIKPDAALLPMPQPKKVAGMKMGGPGL